MTKVLSSISGFVFTIFGIAVLGLLMSLTYQALGRIFPDSFANQMWGLVIFDIAAICWALAFVYKSRSITQYAAAGAGFLVAFVGTLGMVAAEVILSGDLTDVNIEQIGQWMVYGFIGTTAVHTALLWTHHGAAPEIHEQINIGIARGEITTEAIKQATNSLEAEKSVLASTIYAEIYNRVLRDLDIPIPASGTVFEKKQATVMHYPYLPGQEPIPSFTETREKAKEQAQSGSSTSFLAKILNGWGKGDRRFSWLVPNAATLSPAQTPPPSPAQEDAEPAATEDSNVQKYLPPHGDRQHPDLIFAKLPSEQLATIKKAWLDYDNQRMTSAKNEPPKPSDDLTYHPKM